MDVAPFYTEKESEKRANCTSSIFGDVVYSPCNGLIVNALDGLPDLEPSEMDRTHIAGNHVLIASQGRKILLAHLQQGSVLVHTGDIAYQGQPIGKVGNYGNTSEPHLHIHAEQDIASLKERVTALEAVRSMPPLSLAPSIPSADFAILHLMQSRQGFPYEQDGNSGAVIYAGSAHIAEAQYAWQMERPVPGLLQLLGDEPEMLAHTFAALGSPLRLTLLRELLQGPKTSQQIQEALGVSSPGQLYHHLKALLAVGLIEQKSRNLYTLPTRNIIPLLVLLAAAFDTTGKG